MVRARSTRFALLCLVLSALGCGVARAETVKSLHSEAELVSDVTAVGVSGDFEVALRLKSDPGWHTYWQNPGDSGSATRIDWELPPGFRAEAIQWPAPETINYPPLRNFGYSDEILLLTTIHAEGVAPGQKFRLGARARWLVCQDVCVPGRADLHLDLRTTNGARVPDSHWVRRIEAARRALPEDLPPGWSTRVLQADRRIVVTLSPPRDLDLATLRKAELFPVQSGVFDHAAIPPVELKDGQFVFSFPRARNSKEALERFEGVLVIESLDRPTTQEGGERRAYRVSAALPTLASADRSAVDSLLRMLLLALAGGLLLNLMPCVFPVLSLKALGLANEDAGEVRRHALLFALGTLLSFWALAGALILARSAGEAIGWGFQLQSPSFVAFLALLFFVLALNLLGVFEIGSRWAGIGSGLAGRAGNVGAFFSGVLATIVATPCTAPFMGAALGFALAQSAAVAFAVFTALAVGMLTPYLALALSPRALKRMPRPGRWMESIKQFLAFPLLATAAWLVWTLGIQAGVDASARALFGMVGAGLGLWMIGRWPARARIGLAGALVVLASFALAATSSRPGVDADAIVWQPYTPERVEQLRTEGKPIFVDFTAAWCISCQVNERVVFSSSQVREKFRSLGVRMIKADWTNSDPAITHALEALGRSGVPAYVLYGRDPGSPPILLPEVITQGRVLEELEKLK